LTRSLHDLYSQLPESTARSLVNPDPSLKAETDILPNLWAKLKTFLLSTVMSLEGVITHLMHSTQFQNGIPSFFIIDVEYGNMASKLLDILGNLAFISTPLGHSSFDVWNFVYLASIDLLSPDPLKSNIWIERHIPGIHP
jgi:hypothetical protein